MNKKKLKINKRTSEVSTIPVGNCSWGVWMKHDVDTCGGVVEGRKTCCLLSSFCVDASEMKEKLAYNYRE
jgi:hypothetical protein